MEIALYKNFQHPCYIPVKNIREIVFFSDRNYQFSLHQLYILTNSEIENFFFKFKTKTPISLKGQLLETLDKPGAL